MELLNRLFRRPLEKRETQQNLTDAIVSALLAQASGQAPPEAVYTGALEIASGFWGRAMASAMVTPQNPLTAAITPQVLEMTGRQLCRRGEAIFKIVVSPSGKVTLIPSGSYDLRGGPDPETWFYRVDGFGPSFHDSEIVPAAGVLHFRYAPSPEAPWRGRGPLEVAIDSGRLSAALERRLAEEASGPVAQVIPTPENPEIEGSDGDTLGPLKLAIQNAKGKAVFVETFASGGGEGRMAAPLEDWKQKRIGAHPPEVLPKLREAVERTVLNCCGVPSELITPSQGTASREAWRRFLHGTLQPVGRLIEMELTAKLEMPVALGFEPIAASDVQGRARAFQSMVGGGMDIERAAGLSGLLAVEDM